MASTTSTGSRALARPARRGALLLATVLTVSACATARVGDLAGWDASEPSPWRAEELPPLPPLLPLPPADLTGMKEALGFINANPTGLRESLLATRRTNLKTDSKGGSVDQAVKLIQLSYVDADTAIYMLAAMGVNVGTPTTATTNPPTVPSFAASSGWPRVLKIPDGETETFGLVGVKVKSDGTVLPDAQAQVGAKGSKVTIPSAARPISDDAIGSPMTQLMVLYDRNDPGQFSRVRKMIDDYVDRPARQVLIEGMVLEITESGLQELGVEWDLKKLKADGTAGDSRWTGGALQQGLETTAGLRDPTLALAETAVRNLTDEDGFDWFVKIRALIESGKAEILSRPSVLTMNNRQTTIRVGDDIPIARSTAIGSTSSSAAFSFDYLPTGIQLNLRPRINEQGDEVTMLIDTIVSSTDGTERLQLKGTAVGTDPPPILAEAPAVRTRRVRTYARIPNNTPLIIGGLVSRTEQTKEDKVPFLGDLPLVGAAFRATTTRDERREVIIVLTPYVLTEDRERLKPLDADRFDNFGNELFGDSYRLRQRDVYDLSFLYDDPTLQEYRDLALEAVAQDPTLAGNRAVKAFVGDVPPGQDIIATRMLYELLDRLNREQGIVKNGIGNDRILVVDRKSRKPNGYDVRFLQGNKGPSMSQEFGGGATSMRSFFAHHGGKTALRITFVENLSSSGRISRVRPDVSREDCPTEERYQQLLWEWNQPLSQDKRLRTILLRTEDDLKRLRYALALKRLIALNGGPDEVLRKRLTAGSMLLIPSLDPEQGQVMDAEVATYFFRKEHYYSAAIGEIHDRTMELDRKIREFLRQHATESWTQHQQGLTTREKAVAAREQEQATKDLNATKAALDATAKLLAERKNALEAREEALLARRPKEVREKSQMEADQATLEADQATLKAAQAKLEADQAKLAADQAKLALEKANMTK